MGQLSAGVFFVVVVAVVLFLGVSTAGAVVPTWDPEPAAEEEAQEIPPTEEREELVERQQGPTSPYPAFASRGADFNRLGAAEFSLLPGLELVAFQAFYGMTLGYLFCEGVLRCSFDQFWASGFVGLTIGAGAAILANVYLRPSPGQIAVTNSGAYYGLLLGAVVAELASSWEYERYMLVGGIGGMALGALVSTQLRLTAGDVALVNLGGLLAASTLFAVDEFGWNSVAEEVLLGSDWRALGFIAASMVGGGLVARGYPMDRFRVRLIGAGALASAFAMGFMFYMATNSDGAALAGFSLGMVGGGLGTGYLTKEMDEHFRGHREGRFANVVPGVAPRLDGRGATLSLSGRF